MKVLSSITMPNFITFLKLKFNMNMGDHGSSSLGHAKG
jgi:hypothetical protein